MPQLMNTIFLPLGTGLPTGVVTLTVLGRCMAWATTCWAAATPELVLLALLVLAALAALAAPGLFDELPQAATSTASRALAASTTAVRHIRLRAGVDGDMMIVSSWGGLGY